MQNSVFCFYYRKIAKTKNKFGKKEAIDKLDLRMVRNEFKDKFKTKINIFGQFNA